MSPKLRMGLMLVGLVIAAWLAIFGDKTPVNEPVAARGAERARPAPAVRPETAVPVAAEPETDTGPVRRLRSRAGWFELASSGRDIFAPPVVAAPPQAQNEAPPPPPPPEVPFKLIGRLEEQGHWRYFLERDNAVHVLRPGEEAVGFRLESDSGDTLRVTNVADKTSFLIAIDSDKH